MNNAHIAQQITLGSDSMPKSIVDEAFQNALQTCSSTFPSVDVQTWMENKTGIVDVQQALNQAQLKFESKKRSKALKWLTRLSARVNLYGTALDMLAQHHPEYLALAWGSIKFLVVGVMNHEELIKELAKALCRIGDALPQAEIHLLLYPTIAMKDLVVLLYVQIVKFARRAMKWYNESRPMHMIKAITHPYSLRFKDMVDSINEISRRIERLALSLSMAELRHTRLELEESRREQTIIHDIAVETNQKIDTYHTLQHAGLLDTNRRVCEIQFSQVMGFTSDSPFTSPEIMRHYYAVRRNRNRRQGICTGGLLHEAPELRMWAAEAESTELAVCGTFDARQTVRNFAADAIDLIAEAQIPVVWLLNLPHVDAKYSPEDIVKFLVAQVLRKNHTLLNERSAALSAARYQSASTVEDWLNLLGSVLEGLPQVYFLIDIEVLQRSIGDVPSWVNLIRRLFDSLRARGTRTTVKVAFLGSRSAHRAQIAGLDQHKILELPGTPKGRVRKRSENRRAKRARKDGNQTGKAQAIFGGKQTPSA